jgi:hypothetical protein
MTVRLTGASIVAYGTTECPTRTPIDPAQATIPEPYRTRAYAKLYEGQVYHGANGALASQCWETPPAGDAGTFTAVGACAVCQ